MQIEKLQEVSKSFTQKNLPESEIELSGEIPFELISPLEKKALEHFTAEIELPGFRKGHVPPDMVKKKVGDIALLEEAVELFMRDFYPTLLETRSIDAVGRPNIQITKLAPGNPVGITIRAAVYPDVTLPKDWRTISVGVPAEPLSVVEDSEITDALEAIRRAQAKSGDATATPQSDVKPEDLPPLDDAFAQSLGSFVDLADLTAKMRENLQLEKEQKAKDVRRGKIIESLLEKTSLAVPTIFVDSELEKIMSQMREDISRYGLEFDEYLKRVGKSEEDIRNEFRDQARKRAKLQLILNKIATDEKLEADKDTVEKELSHATEHFPDARPDLVRIHIETVLRNEKALQLLESTEKNK
jgi:FKBP-type peptidyl-prolyl cis-trans isomerase (trigger factor)